MVFFYFKYGDNLQGTWTIDAMVMCIVYIVSAMFVFGALCHLTSKQFKVLQQKNDESNKAREKAESLLDEIKHSVDINVEATSKAMEDISDGAVNLHSNIDNVVNGYNEINSMTTALVEAATK